MDVFPLAETYRAKMFSVSVIQKPSCIAASAHNLCLYSVCLCNSESFRILFNVK